MTQGVRLEFQGSLVAIVTPMLESGAIDWTSLDRLVDWHLESGTHGIVAVGTTGESATLADDEHIQVVEAVVKRVDGRVPVIAGTGSNATTHSIELSTAAKSIGADACLIVTPYYNKPTQEGLYQHYCAIADAVDIPIVLYNVPSRTACDMSAETVYRLSSHQRIVGIKEACGHTERVSEILQKVADPFFVLSGEDSQTLDMMLRGAKGTISVTANVAPRQMASFCEQFLSGAVEEAKSIDAQLQPVHEILFVETNPIPTKWALAAMGRINNGIRLPLVGLSVQHHQAVSDRLFAIGSK